MYCLRRHICWSAYLQDYKIQGLNCTGCVTRVDGVVTNRQTKIYFSSKTKQHLSIIDRIIKNVLIDTNKDWTNKICDDHPFYDHTQNCGQMCLHEIHYYAVM